MNYQAWWEIIGQGSAKKSSSKSPEELSIPVIFKTAVGVSKCVASVASACAAAIYYYQEDFRPEDNYNILSNSF